MNKCEWIQMKDFSFQFKPCDRFNGKIIEGFYSTDVDNSCIDTFCKCKQCGADISKPEENPTIRRSGETWVARYYGVDYFWFDDRCKNNNEPLFFIHGRKEEGICSGWKPFSEIEITDEIAKLRPMVIRVMDRTVHSLYAVVNGFYVLHGNMPRSAKTGSDIDYRLAKVSDLEE